MKEYPLDQVTHENIKYFEYMCNNDFYKNDREFITIIKKLTQQSASISNKALNLITLLDEAERIKFEMVQKEIALGLSQEDLPYGEKSIEQISNLVMKHSTLTPKKKAIERFIHLIEEYFTLENPSDKKITLLEAHDLMVYLNSHEIAPKHLIITRERAKVWHLLEHSFLKTMKQLDIDFFIEKIRLTRIQHQSVIDEIQDHYREKQKAFVDIGKAKEENNQDEIGRQKKIIQKPLGVNIEPLLIDTQKIVDSLDFMLEEIPETLTSKQREELKRFIPALSEFYQDQCYAISGGNSYTTLAKNLTSMQHLIDQNVPIRELLKAVNNLGITMQHLYILHWMAESILKDVLKVGFMMMGGLVKIYKEKNSLSDTNFKNIKEAVRIRNDIAHNAMIWDPKKLIFAVETYRIYIEIVIQQQNIDTKTYRIKKMNRELTEEQLMSKIDQYVNRIFKMSFSHIEELDNDLALKMKKALEKKSFVLSKEDQEYYKKRFQMIERDNDHRNRDEFTLKYFNMSYLDVYNKLIEYQKKQDNNFDENNSEHIHKAVGGLRWLYHNQDAYDADKTISIIENKIKGNLWSKMLN